MIRVLEKIITCFNHDTISPRQTVKHRFVLYYSKVLASLIRFLLPCFTNRIRFLSPSPRAIRREKEGEAEEERSGGRQRRAMVGLGVKAAPFTYVSHVLAAASAVLVLVWCIHFRGGLAFESSNKNLIFNVVYRFFISFVYLLLILG
jgi:hypothetical protein